MQGGSNYDFSKPGVEDDPHAGFEDEYGGAGEDDGLLQAELARVGAGATAAKIVDNLTGPQKKLPAPPAPEDDEADESYLDDVDFRLEVAQTYRELLRTPLYTEPTKATGIVEREIRAYVRERLELLLSMRAAKLAVPVVQPLPFSDIEIKAIKILIGELMKRPELLQAVSKTEPEKKPATQAPVPRRPAPAKEQLATRPTAPPAAPRLNRATPPPPLNPHPPAPAPEPEEPTAPAQAPAAAKPGKKPRAPKQPGPALTEKRMVESNDGQMHEIEVQRIQRPSGQVPFPSDLSVSTAAHSMASAQAGAKVFNQKTSEMK